MEDLVEGNIFLDEEKFKEYMRKLKVFSEE
jgi:hypothetical protein